MGLCHGTTAVTIMIARQIWGTAAVLFLILGTVAIISGGSGVAWGLFGILPLAAFCGALVGEHDPSDL
jgi:hypothetical protein